MTMEPVTDLQALINYSSRLGRMNFDEETRLGMIARQFFGGNTSRARMALEAIAENPDDPTTQMSGFGGLPGTRMPIEALIDRDGTGSAFDALGDFGSGGGFGGGGGGGRVGPLDAGGENNPDAYPGAPQQFPTGEGAGGPMGFGDTGTLTPEQERMLERDRLSEFRSGRQRLFNEYLASNPRFADVTPSLRNLYRNQFGAASALWGLRGATTGSTENFRQWLSGIGEGGLPNFRQGVQNEIGALRDAGEWIREGETPGAYQRRIGGQRGAALRGLMENDEIMANILRTADRGRFSPLLNRFVDEQRSVAFDRSRDTNPFQLLSQFGGGQPWWNR